MKKKYLGLVLILILLLTLSIGLTSCNNKGDENNNTQVTDFTEGLMFRLKSDNTYEVEGYNGSSDNVCIPNTYKNKPVNSIGYEAFKGQTRLLSVSIPEGITNIDINAFRDCVLLKEVNLPSTIKKIARTAFAQCSSINNLNVKEPSKVEYVSTDAFTGCNNITSANIPYDICLVINTAKISNLTLNNCKVLNKQIANKLVALKKLTLGEGCKAIEEDAFVNSNGLESVSLPKTLQTLQRNAFINTTVKKVYISDINQWTNLDIANPEANPLFYGADLIIGDKVVDSVEIKKGTKEVKSNIFVGYKKLKSVTLPDSITKINKNAFENCTNLERVNIDSISSWCKMIKYSTPLKYAHNLYEKGKLVTNIEVPSGVREINESTFEGLYNVEEIKLPNSILHIGKNAFKDCQINDIKLPISVHKIEDFAFSGCCNLKRVIVPTNVSHIGKEAFSKSSIASIYIPDSVEYIGEDAFNGDINLSICIAFAEPKATWDKNWNSSQCAIKINTCIIGDFVYYGDIDGNLEVDVLNKSMSTVQIPDYIMLGGKKCYIKKISASAFKNASNLSNVILPNKLEEIGEYTFKNCRKLTSIYIPSSVTSIGKSAFESCKALKTIDWSNGLKNIGNNAFSICSSLEEIVLPSSLLSIGDYAFNGNLSVTKIVLPNNLSSIGRNAFSVCNKVKEIVIPKSVKTIGEDAFLGCKNLDILCESKGRNTNFDYNWSANRPVLWNYGGEKGITDNFDWVKRQDNTLIIREYLGNNSNVVMPTVINDYIVTSLGENIFKNNKNITSIELPKLLERIGGNLLVNCISIKEIIIPITVDYVEYKAFDSCPKLTIYCMDSADTADRWSRDWNVNVQNVVYNYNKVTSNAEYDYYYYNDVAYLCNYKSANKDVVVPSIIDGYKVIDVAGTFSEKNITNLTIPEGVMILRSYTTNWNRYIKKIVIPNSVKVIENEALYIGNLDELVYNGTMAEWNNVKKDKDWCYSMSINIVKCLDGDVAIK